ncbi:jerky protein homolog-like [Sipha flava]|uniref:Jerky protein homolog-like n=1 Tax=Sipha flava TaxID=143950 RepID=A0A8B8FGA4_9HEMI|nr:jerky protein homolog-like [Sipha flava]
MNTKLKGPEDFKASSELLSADSSSAENFKQTFQLFVEIEGYSQDSVHNADENGLLWKALPKKSFASCQEHAARGLKVSKERVTIMTCANNAGTHKLPLLLIGKSKKPRCFKNIKSLPDHHKIGKVLLDNAPTHSSTDVLNLIDPDYQVMFLPPNVTSLIQPVYQGVIEKFRRMYRKQMLRRLLLNLGTEESVVAFSKLLNLKHCCYMAADAWDNLTEKNLRNAQKKFWVASMELEAEEKTDLNNLDDFVDLFNEIPGFNDCNYYDAIDWLATDVNDLGYQILDCDEIISSLQNEESDDSSDKSMGAPKDHHLLKHLLLLKLILRCLNSRPNVVQHNYFYLNICET